MSWPRSHNQKITDSDPLILFLRHFPAFYSEGVWGAESELSIRGVGWTRRAAGGHSEKEGPSLPKKRAPGTPGNGGKVYGRKEGSSWEARGAVPTKELGGLIRRPGLLGR